MNKINLKNVILNLYGLGIYYYILRKKLYINCL